MKRIFFLSILFLISIIGFSQPNFDGITGLKYLGSDTIESGEVIILNGDTIKFGLTVADGQVLQRYQREDGKHVWTNRDRVIPEGILSGGYITQLDSLTFEVDAVSYYLGGTVYYVPKDTVILSDPDPVYPRIDVIAVSTLGKDTIIEGVPSENPQKPTIDHLTQIELTQVLVMKDSIATNLTSDNYGYWGLKVNTGARIHITRHGSVNFNGITDGILVTRSSQNINFRADTTLLATISMLRDSITKIRSEIINTNNSVNDSVQALTGTSPTFDIIHGNKATLTLTGNTQITLSGLTAGSYGTVFVTNGTPVYQIKFPGFNCELGPNIDADSSGLFCSGSVKYDSFAFVYTGSVLIVHATFDYTPISW